MNLNKIIEKANILDYKFILLNSIKLVDSITLSSEEAKGNSIFVAIKGFQTDGHIFIIDAYNNGCRNFIVENIDYINDDIAVDSSIVLVNDSRGAFGKISNLFYDFPFKKLKMVGITGTKGKTTVSILIYTFLKNKYKTSLFSTIKNIINNKEIEANRTTMEANELEKALRDSLNRRTTHSVVEVSSHAVTLKRIVDVEFDIGVFTSFSQDHLDLYKTMKNYFEAKLDFFRMLNNSSKKNKYAVINMVDKRGIDVANILNKSVKKIGVGYSDDCEVKILREHSSFDGLEVDFSYNKKTYSFSTKIRGRFNILNIVISYIVALLLGVKSKVINNSLAKINGIEGRFDIVVEKPFMVIVDYAHNPDSLRKILIEAKKIAKGNLIVVFGCGGDRDKEKRPIMGNIATSKASYTFITNDDTYREDPNAIIKMIVSGIKKYKNDKFSVILDRKEAIKAALLMAKDGDVIVVAGMGHQKYQIIDNEKIKYNDKDTILSIVKELNFS